MTLDFFINPELFLIGFIIGLTLGTVAGVAITRLDYELRIEKWGG